MKKTHIYTHASCLKHDTGAGHPECPQRLQVLLELFREKPFSALPLIQAQEAELEWIYRAHDEKYVMALETAMPEDGFNYADADTVLSPGTWQAALHAAGAVCQAVNDVLAGKCDRAFCAARPPGHHAFPVHAEGFCLFNNVFIGALHAQKAHDLVKIAILDFDVHHGNGSDAMARKHENVFYGSTHQWPLYPGTGHPQQNIPRRIANRILAAGDGSAAFRKAWVEIIAELEEFKPELVFISAGFDAHRDDPLAQINLLEDDFRWITGELVKVADRHSGGKVISVLEGGYNLKALKTSTAAHLAALAEIS
jgi:acetoin utilization deacetylase AcuC-like enzyme